MFLILYYSCHFSHPILSLNLHTIWFEGNYGREYILHLQLVRLSSNEDNRKKDSWNKLLTNSCLSIFFSRVVMLLSSVSFMMVTSACKEYMTLKLLLFTFSRGSVNIVNRTRKQLLVRLIWIWTIEKGGNLRKNKVWYSQHFLNSRYVSKKI